MGYSFGKSESGEVVDEGVGSGARWGNAVLKSSFWEELEGLVGFEDGSEGVGGDGCRGFGSDWGCGCEAVEAVVEFDDHQPMIADDVVGGGSID